MGMLIDGQEVQVGEFMRRNERPGQSEWTNCYVKNMPYEWDDAKLKEEFSKYGEVLSASVSMGVRKRRPKKKVAALKNEEDKDSSNEKDAPESAEEEAKKDSEPEPESKPEPEPEPEPETEKSGDDESNEKEDTKEEESEGKVESLGFGFVNFVEHESAVEAVEQLNEKEFETVIDGETVKQ